MHPLKLVRKNTAFYLPLLIYADFENHKKDKKSDYVICKVKNRRYLAIIEIKLNVGSALSAKKANWLAKS